MKRMGRAGRGAKQSRRRRLHHQQLRGADAHGDVHGPPLEPESQLSKRADKPCAESGLLPLGISHGRLGLDGRLEVRRRDVDKLEQLGQQLRIEGDPE